MKGNGLHMITWVLLIIGGLNWLLIGIFNWGVGDVLGTSVSRVVYIIVGLSALYQLFTHKGQGMQSQGGTM